MAEVIITSHVEEVKKAMSEQIDRALTEAGAEAESYAKVEIESDPRRVDTGRLRNSITHTLASEGSERYAVIGTNVEYAIYVHEGTGIHAAEGGGRTTPWMFKGSDGQWHFTRGMKPNRFLRNAIENNRSQLMQTIEDSLKKE